MPSPCDCCQFCFVSVRARIKVSADAKPALSWGRSAVAVPPTRSLSAKTARQLAPLLLDELAINFFGVQLLLEAEFCSALAGEGFAHARKWLEGISWVYPDRPSTKEFNKILDAGHLKGADLWHVATALYVSPNPRDLAIITLDIDMKSLTSSLGFIVARQLRDISKSGARRSVDQAAVWFSG